MCLNASTGRLCLALAWACLRLYDLPVRRYLMNASMITQHKANRANSDESM